MLTGAGALAVSVDAVADDDACRTLALDGAGAAVASVVTDVVAEASRITVETAVGADAVRVTTDAEDDVLVAVVSTPYEPVP